MRSVITNFTAPKLNAISIISMNKIGAVTDAGISCNTLNIDAVNGDFLKTLTLAYKPEGPISYIQAVTSKGLTLSRGVLTSNMIKQDLNSSETQNILSFWGFENNRISRLALVT